LLVDAALASRTLRSNRWNNGRKFHALKQRKNVVARAAWRDGISFSAVCSVFPSRNFGARVC